MLNARFAVAALLAAVVAIPAQAQTISINNIAPTWSNITPNGISNLSIDNSGSTVRLFWGSTEDDRSSFSFDDRETPLSITLSGGTARFSLGQFTHENNRIGGTSLTGARLNLVLGLTSASPSTFTTSILFNHEETPNANSSQNPCAYGAPVNANGCADRVTLGAASGSQSFMFNSQQYFFTLLGFSSSASTYTPINGVVTPEDGRNNAYVWGEISRANVVPEPSTYALMATGMIGLVGVARRRRAVKA